MQSLCQFRAGQWSLIHRVALSQTRTPAMRLSLSLQYHQTTRLGYPYKDDQDRKSLKPKSTDSTRSGTDDDVAHTDVAFDPSKTRPETEKKQADKEAKKKQGNKGTKISPLEASPANQNISKPQGDHGKEG